MIQRVKDKVHSNTGASLLLALLFLMISMTIGSMIISAAMANRMKNVDLKRKQQEYASAESAADIIASMIYKSSLREVKTITETQVFINNVWVTQSTDESYSNEATGELKNILIQLKTMSLSTYTLEEEISVTGVTMPQMKVVFSMDDDFTVHVIIKNGIDVELIKMTFSPMQSNDISYNITEDIEAGNRVKEEKEYSDIIWQECAVSKGSR